MGGSRSGSRRALALTAGFLRYAGVASLAIFGVDCTETLDAGHNRPPDPCAARDAALTGCVPPGLVDNLIGYWRLDEEPGSTIAHDSSGRGNDGILHGLDASTAWVAGRWQGALELGHAGWVQVASSADIDSIADSITVSAWVDLEGTISPSDIFGTALSRQTGMGIDQYYHLSLLMNGRPNLLINTLSGFQSFAGPEPAPKGTWTHLATVYDGAVARLYVNGVEVANKDLTGSFAPDTTSIIIGGNDNDASGVPTELFPGRLDEVALYARALSAAEIAQLAAGALSPAGYRDAGAD
ncbi:MAG TPA: LamG domain-containing protein [Polyangia bacterium]|jgi:hypothetical protein